MSEDRSSANPAKLAQYSADGLDLLATLRVKADAVTSTLDRLRASGSELVPRMGDVDQDLTDLVDDWAHLDGFAGAVANAFVAADLADGHLSPQGANRVMTFRDATLQTHGRIGYADREEAIAAAQDMAARLRSLREQLQDEPRSISPEEIQGFVAMAERGQHDPAFAVAFSEAIGVAGYADAVAMIRGAYQRDTIHDPVPAEGVAAVQVLAATLTTALNRPVEDEGVLDDVVDVFGFGSSRGSDARALDRDFVDALTSGFDPLEGQANTDRPFRIQSDLSVLLRFTDPPTEVAVDIANGRLTPLLQDHDALDVRDNGEEWGDFGGSITNYATMLGRNEDASALWLNDSAGDGAHNIDLVLQRNPDYPDFGHDIDIDGGEALARVVENGLTNTNPELTATGPSDDDVPRPLREVLMERTIEVIGDQDEIRNGHLHDVFATAVDHNIEVVDRLVNEHIEAPGETVSHGVYQTHDFLREVMRDDDAARHVRETIYDHVQDQMLTLPADEDAAIAQYEESGRLLGVITMADANVDVGAVEDRIADQERSAGGVDYVLGWVPYLGEVNDIADDLAGNGAGAIVFDSGQPLDEGADAVRTHVDRMDLNIAGLAAVGMYESGQWESADVVATTGVDFFAGQPGDPDRQIKPFNDMTQEELDAFYEWSISDVTGREQSGRSEYLVMVGGASHTSFPLLMRT